MQRSIRKFVLPLLILVLGFLLRAEERPAQPPPRPEIPNLHAIATRSGYVFAGTVKAVGRIKPRNQDSVAVMRITFHVDHGYRGVHTGQTFAIHEWAGLWENGERYRPGERVMLFLYPPSKLGLTSPVPNGRFPVDSGGRIVIRSERRSSTSPQHGQSPPNLRISLEDFGLALRRAEQE
jgi:hypothetical protein